MHLSLSCVYGGGRLHSHSSPEQSKTPRFISPPPLTDSHLPLRFRRHVVSISILYRYFHAGCSSNLANCMPQPSCCLATHAFLVYVIPLRSRFLGHEVTSIFTPSSVPFFFFFINNRVWEYTEVRGSYIHSYIQSLCSVLPNLHYVV